MRGETEAEGAKVYRDNVEALRKSRSGGSRLLKQMDTSGVQSMLGMSPAPVVVPRFLDREGSVFRAPDRFFFAIEGEVKAPEMDHHSRRSIGIVACHLELEEFHRRTHKSSTWHANYRCFHHRSDT